MNKNCKKIIELVELRQIKVSMKREYYQAGFTMENDIEEIDKSIKILIKDDR